MNDHIVKTSRDWISVPDITDTKEMVQHAASQIAARFYGGIPRNISKRFRGTYLFDVETQSRFCEGVERVYVNRTVSFKGYPQILFTPETILFSTFFSGVHNDKRHKPQAVFLCELGNQALYWCPRWRLFTAMEYLGNNIFSVTHCEDSWRWIIYSYGKRFSLPGWRNVDRRIISALGEKKRIDSWGRLIA